MRSRLELAGKVIGVAARLGQIHHLTAELRIYGTRIFGMVTPFMIVVGVSTKPGQPHKRRHRAWALLHIWSHGDARYKTIRKK